MWASVRDAVSILVGGNLGEIGFTLGATSVSRLTSRSCLASESERALRLARELELDAVLRHQEDEADGEPRAEEQ